MAQNPPCMIEECDQLATFTGTFFETGQSIIVCGSHFDDFAAAMLESSTGIPVTALILMDPATFATDEPAVEPDDDDHSTDAEETSDEETPADHELTEDERDDLIRDGGGVVDANDDDEPSQTSD